MLNIGLNEHGDKVYPSSGVKAKCFICGGELISACGDVYVHHFRHINGDENCASRHMTRWHLHWQEVVDKKYIELSIDNHRADIVHPKGYVIEIQHSPISNEDVVSRKQTYKKIVWILDYTETTPNKSRVKILSKFSMTNMDKIILDFGNGWMGLVEEDCISEIKFKRIHISEVYSKVFGVILRENFSSDIHFLNDIAQNKHDLIVNFANDKIKEIKTLVDDKKYILASNTQQSLTQIQSTTCSVTSQALEHIQTIAKQQLKELFPIYEEELTKKQKSILVWVKSVYENNNDIPQKYKSLNQIKQLFTPLSLDEKIIFNIYFPEFNLDWKPKN